MRGKGVLLVGRAIAQVRPYQEERRALRFLTRGGNGAANRLKVIPILDGLGVPSIRGKTACAILGEVDLRRRRERHAVVIVEVDQLSQLQMTGKGSSFRGYPFHEVAIADQSVGEMIDDLESGTVVPRREIRFGNRDAHSVSKSLT